jgi:hypothetical protein
MINLSSSQYLRAVAALTRANFPYLCSCCTPCCYPPQAYSRHNNKQTTTACVSVCCRAPRARPLPPVAPSCQLTRRVRVRLLTPGRASPCCGTATTTAQTWSTRCGGMHAYRIAGMGLWDMQAAVGVVRAGLYCDGFATVAIVALAC